MITFFDAIDELDNALQINGLTKIMMDMVIISLDLNLMIVKTYQGHLYIWFWVVLIWMEMDMMTSLITAIVPMVFLGLTAFWMFRF